MDSVVGRFRRELRVSEYFWIVARAKRPLSVAEFVAHLSHQSLTRIIVAMLLADQATTPTVHTLHSIPRVGDCTS